MAYPPPRRVEITCEEYQKVVGHTADPAVIGVTIYGSGIGGPCVPLIEYVFIEPDEPDTARSEIEFLEQLYKL